MAQRRMFSLKVVDTDNFLAMPISARLLYYDLAMRADDDGFVDSPRKILKIIGCAEDDLKILFAKQYLIPFETGVCVIKHWHIHNLIRSDRYAETEYKNEKSQLIEINNKYELPTSGMQNVIPNDNQMATQDRIGKDRLGRSNIVPLDTQNPSKTTANAVVADATADNIVISQPKQQKIPYQEIVDLYHEILVPRGLTKIKILTDDRKRKIAARWRSELPNIEKWKTLFGLTYESDFLCGETKDRDGRSFYADFDWLICPRNCVKVLERKYDNKRRGSG